MPILELRERGMERERERERREKFTGKGTGTGWPERYGMVLWR